jgi:hypothetical protein
MGMVTGVACQGANGRERPPQDSINAQAHIGVILCRGAFRRQSFIIRHQDRADYPLLAPSAGFFKHDSKRLR